MTKLNDHEKLKIIRLLLHNPQESYDAIQARTAVDVRRLDWHEYSNYLDFLNTSGFVMVTGISRDGMCQYRLNPDRS